LDFTKLGMGERLAGLGGIVLIGVMFLDWWGVPTGLGSLPQGLPGGVPGGTGGQETGVDAWSGLDFIDFVLLLTGASGIGLAWISAVGRRANIPVAKGVFACFLGALSVLLIVWRICDPVADGSLKIGIFLGLIAAAAVGIGGYMTAAAQGFELFTPVGGRSPASQTTRVRATGTRKQ